MRLIFLQHSLCHAGFSFLLQLVSSFVLWKNNWLFLEIAVKQRYTLTWGRAAKISFTHYSRQLAETRAGYWFSGLVAKLCPGLAKLWTVAHQASLSLGFSRPEYWSGLPSPPPGVLPDPGIEPGTPASPALQANSLSLSHQGSHVLGPNLNY